MQNYLSQRSLAALLKTDSATIARLATELSLGTSGTHPNSAKTFSPADCDRIGKIHFANKEGALRNQLVALDADRLQNARDMGRLAGLARAMSSPAWRELEDLAQVVARIDAGLDIDRNRVDLKTLEGRTKFCANFKKHRGGLADALNAVHEKL